MTNFQKYLKKEATSRLLSGEGDEDHSGEHYLVQGVSSFFPLATRELRRDGMDKELIVWFLLEAAHDVLADGNNYSENANDALIKMVMEQRMDPPNAH